MIYKQLSADMRDGLKNIYKQISSASDNSPEDLFAEASSQLQEVVKTTESAAMSIMEVVEKQLDQTEATEKLLTRIKEKLDDKDYEELKKLNEDLRNDLTRVLTALSFQDLAGQRIKKVTSVLSDIEASILDLYLSSGLIMEGAEKNPEKDAETLQNEARKVVNEFHENRKSGSELKGPDSGGVSQAAIDEMLDQLGL